MAGAVEIRTARPSDASAIARLITMAGGGVYEFLLDGLFGDLDTVALMTPSIVEDTGIHSYPNAIVAVAGRRVIGLAHAYPASAMIPANQAVLPQDRLDHLAAFEETQDPGSCFLSALAVEQDYRRRGIASHLIALTESRARTAGFDRLTLHVWADNRPARALYRRQGFRDVAVAAIPWHPRLPHAGGSVLMRKTIA